MIYSDTELPPLDPSPIVQAIERLAEPSGVEEANGKRSLVGWFLAALAAIAGVAIVSWVLFRNQRELARLRHEKNKQAILKKQAEIDARAAMLEDEAAQAARKIEQANERLLLLAAERKRIEMKYEANRAALSRVTSFDQFRFRR